MNVILRDLISLCSNVKREDLKKLFLQVLDSSQTLLPADELKKRFEQEG